MVMNNTETFVDNASEATSALQNKPFLGISGISSG
jgi:hypothetical protein